MGRRAHFLIFGAMAAVAAAAVYTWSSDAFGGEPASASPDPTAPATRPGGDALRTGMKATHETVPRPTRAQASLQRDPDRASDERSAADAARAEAAKAELEDPTAADREASELASRCDTKISGEPVDPEWSRMKNEQFSAFFARPPLASAKPKAVDCRSTMCRFELTYRSIEDRKRFIQSFSDLAGPTGMVFAHIETDSDLDIVVYVTRDGVGLP